MHQKIIHGVRFKYLNYLFEIKLTILRYESKKSQLFEFVRTLRSSV